MFYLVVVFVPMALMSWAQHKVKSNYQRGLAVPAPMSGAEAARQILAETGLTDVAIEETGGQLSDHYDPRTRVLRLSRDVFHGKTAASVGIAAHEAGHAIQHATRYPLLVVRNAAVPAANYGPRLSMFLMMFGGAMQSMPMIILGIAAFGCLAFFQLVNLPVEFDASNRAKKLIDNMHLVDSGGAVAVDKVLNAAAWTYVAGTLSSVLQLFYYAARMLGGRRS